MKILFLQTTLSSALICLSGIFPVLFFKKFQNTESKNFSEEQFSNSKILRHLINFSIGTLLFDALCHVLPEACELISFPIAAFRLVIGIIVFFVIEKLSNLRFPFENTDNNSLRKNQIAAQLNLLANAMDNFCHGLTVGSAFLINSKTGYFTSFGILLHEIPHEFGDFALLLRSNKTLFQCSLYQLTTSFTSFLGGWTALFIGETFKDIALSWLLPLSAGGFIFIACTSVRGLFESSNLTRKWDKCLLTTNEAAESISSILGVFVMYYAMKFC